MRLDYRLPPQTQLAAICLTLMLALPGCGKTPGPTTHAALIAAYQSAYDSGDKPAVLALMKWDGVPDDLRKLSESLLTFGIGKQKITRIELIPYEPDPEIPMEIEGRKVEPNLPPAFWLIAEKEGHDGFQNSKSSGSLKYAVGVENGIYRFCGMRWAN